MPQPVRRLRLSRIVVLLIPTAFLVLALVGFYSDRLNAAYGEAERYGLRTSKWSGPLLSPSGKPTFPFFDYATNERFSRVFARPQKLNIGTPGPETPEQHAMVFQMFERSPWVRHILITHGDPSSREAIFTMLGERRQLEVLDCWGPQPQDEDIAKLADLPRLYEITFSTSQVTPAAFEAFARMERLERLNLGECPNLTPEDLDELRRELPGVSIKVR